MGGIDLAKAGPTFTKKVEFVCNNISIICSSTIYLKFSVNRSVFPFVYYCLDYLPSLFMVDLCSSNIWFLNILYFLKYSCTNILHRRSLYTLYGNVSALPFESICLICFYISCKKTPFQYHPFSFRLHI